MPRIPWISRSSQAFCAKLCNFCASCDKANTKKARQWPNASDKNIQKHGRMGDILLMAYICSYVHIWCVNWIYQWHISGIAMKYWCVLRREFSGMIHNKLSIIPATPSNPSIPYVKRTRILVDLHGWYLAMEPGRSTASSRSRDSSCTATISTQKKTCRVRKST